MIDGVGARAKRRVGKVRHALALTRRLHPDRNRDRIADRRDDGLDASRVELSRYGVLLGLARIWGTDIQLQHANACLLDLPRHAQCMIHIGKDDACHRQRVVRSCFPVQTDRIVKPLLKRCGPEPGSVRDGGRARCIRSPRDGTPMLVKRHILRGLELVLGILRFVHRLQHNCANAGLYCAPHAVLVDEMIRRARNHWVAQLGTPHTRRKIRHVWPRCASG